MSNIPIPNDNGQPETVSTPAEEFESRNRLPDEVNSDPFDDLDSLRLSQDYASQAPVRKVLTTVPCRKPNRHEFIRVRAGQDWRFETTAFEDKVNRDTYLVSRDLRTELFDETSSICFFLTMNRQQDVFLWPVKLPGPDG